MRLPEPGMVASEGHRPRFHRCCRGEQSCQRRQGRQRVGADREAEAGVVLDDLEPLTAYDKACLGAVGVVDRWFVSGVGTNLNRCRRWNWSVAVRKRQHREWRLPGFVGAFANLALAALKDHLVGRVVHDPCRQQPLLKRPRPRLQGLDGAGADALVFRELVRFRFVYRPVRLRWDVP